jgi:hypothetical protein
VAIADRRFVFLAIADRRFIVAVRQALLRRTVSMTDSVLASSHANIAPRMADGWPMGGRSLGGGGNVNKGMCGDLSRCQQGRLQHFAAKAWTT